MTEEKNPNDPAAREIRAKAQDYADRVLAGEKPWEDADAEVDAGADAGFETVPEPTDDDVGETGVENPDEVRIEGDTAVEE